MNYYISKPGGEPQGPYALEQIKAMWAAGSITADTLYFNDAAQSWLPVQGLLVLEPKVQRPVRAQPKKPTSGMMPLLLLVLFVAVPALVFKIGWGYYQENEKKEAEQSEANWDRENMPLEGDVRNLEEAHRFGEMEGMLKAGEVVMEGMDDLDAQLKKTISSIGRQYEDTRRRLRKQLDEDVSKIRVAEAEGKIKSTLADRQVRERQSRWEREEKFLRKKEHVERMKAFRSIDEAAKKRRQTTGSSK